LIMFTINMPLSKACMKWQLEVQCMPRIDMIIVFVSSFEQCCPCCCCKMFNEAHISRLFDWKVLLIRHYKDTMPQSSHMVRLEQVILIDYISFYSVDLICIFIRQGKHIPCKWERRLTLRCLFVIIVWSAGKVIMVMVISNHGE
jgi:hypothetical protein